MHYICFCYLSGLIVGQKLKNSLYVVCALLLLLQAGGLAWVYNYRLVHWKSAAKHRLERKDKSRWVQLSMPVDQYEAAKVERNELRLGGEMYDVVKMTINGNRVLVTAEHDKEETNLLEQLAGALGNSDAGNPNGVPKKILDLLSMAYLLPSAWAQNPLLPVAEMSPQKQHYAGYQCQCTNGVPLPPPKA